ncbi:MAG: tyrosine-type recombinase/integrase [Deltaproteobacteria bacterium]|nr:tyrosine-type recombinase/integrase [Deltaproteobacteria bacterium]
MSIAFERAKKTFLGFLQARGKAVNTVKNYACDLGELGAYVEKRSLDFQRLGLPELEGFHQSLKEKGLRPNSRRRKIMTARTFLRYLSGRMDVSTIGSEKLIPPEKVEKPPRLVPRESVFAIIDAQPDTDMGWRNRALIGVLLDTGMLVTEALALRPMDCYWDTTQEKAATLSVSGKRARSSRVSPQTAEALRQLTQRLKTSKYFFHGYSRSGPNAERMTSRGVEVLFKGWSKTFGQKHLHPRTLRHLYVVDQLLKGKTENEVMQAIALRTPYAFRVYRPLIQEILEKAVAPVGIEDEGTQAAAEEVRP